MKSLTKDEQWLIDEKYDGSTENKAALRADMNRLALGEPLAYVIGWTPFLDLRIYLDSHPLIPRPETEWWTEELLLHLASVSPNALPVEPGVSRSAAEVRLAQEATEGATRKNRLDQEVMTGSTFRRRFLDLCAGSGAVGCAVLKEVPGAHVSFGELIQEHEATIRKNIEENGLDASRADIRIGDLFAPFAGDTFDVIAVNPPYIPDGRELDGSVTRYEPREALRSGEDGLDLIRRIAAEVSEHMNPDGELWLECDTSNIVESCSLVLAGGAKDAIIRTDPYGRPRIVVGYY